MLTQVDIEAFANIYYQEFGIRLSLKEATEKAHGLLNFYRTILSDDFSPAQKINAQKTVKQYD